MDVCPGAEGTVDAVKDNGLYLRIGSGTFKGGEHRFTQWLTEGDGGAGGKTNEGQSGLILIVDQIAHNAFLGG